MLIMTRWHEDDLAGRLQAAEPAWSCLRLPAIAEDEDMLAGGRGRFCGRNGRMRRRFCAGGGKWVSALLRRCISRRRGRRMRPCSEVRNIRIVAEAPAFARTIRAWDLAASLPGAGQESGLYGGVETWA